MKYGVTIEPHPAITRSVKNALLKGGSIVSVHSHEGSPGGHNNDLLEIHMESGKVVVFNIYSLYPMAVSVEKAQARS